MALGVSDPVVTVAGMRTASLLRSSGVAAVVAMVAVGCSADGLDRAEPAPPELGEPVADSSLDWEVCEEADLDLAGTECAWLPVPIDHADPGGPTIDIALNRAPATGAPEDRIGSLVVNPGGPGASGVDLAADIVDVLAPEIRERFDVVGMDPRGVARSAPVRCLDDEEHERNLGIDLLPTTAEGVERIVRSEAATNEACTTRNPDLVRHLSTADAASDLDLVRAALGDDQLTYLGVSYGTRLGAVYASMFPDRVRALVLDAAMGPGTDELETVRVQAEGFEQVEARFVESCDGDPDCALGPDAAAAMAAARARLETRPIELDTPTGPRELDRGTFDGAVAAAMYSTSQWGALANAVSDLDDGGAATMLALADQMAGRNPDGSWDNMADANRLINCSDTPDRFDRAQAIELRDELAGSAPTFGPLLGWELLGCTSIPLAANPMPEIDASGADPVLIIGGIDDPATPYVWAEELAEALVPGVLVTWEGSGHGATLGGGECIEDVLVSYVVDLEVPRPGAVCAGPEEPISFGGPGDELIEMLIADGVPSDEAACAVAGVQERLGVAEVDRRLMADDGADELAAALGEATAACG